MLARHAVFEDPAIEGIDLRWLWVLGAVAAGASILALALLADRPALAAGMGGAAVLTGALGFLSARRRPAVDPIPPGSSDPAESFALASAALQLSSAPAAVTDGEARLLLANAAFGENFDESDPFAEPDGPVRRIVRVALADGRAEQELHFGGEDCARVVVRRIGHGGAPLLLWHFPPAQQLDRLAQVAQRIAGATGERLSAAGVLAVVTDSDGVVLAANEAFTRRAFVEQPETAPVIADLVSPDGEGHVRLVAEGEGAVPLRAVTVPTDPERDERAGTLLLFEVQDMVGLAGSENVQALLELLPLGMALVDRDGRFLTMNRAFRTAGGLARDAMPSYPGDLVVKEDKATVADTVRRHARGPAMSSDLAVRLASHPKEPVALTVAGLRGIGEATVLLLLKDNSEEAKLKRQIAQATKMQAVGQLAGGVAHDFNNILTAIIGHCDLMLMRHTPGDSDYDDIQQIKSNSNRAAGLTRQLLAFSRQQTLRPQVLQLADVVAEVSHLLKRLLGETVELKVKHGRDVGSVRADPGQLEQVIVNLAVNARDAMLDKGGGTLTIQSYKVRADQVADIGSEILPVADYAALSITDTGSGIPASVLGKIFEPFFTTKEVGKGTGLGLSTVYGIVKQSGGYIFADSKVGEGTSFAIYLPVHEVAETERARPAGKANDNDSELWGSGTILLVEDEPMVRTVAERALTRHGYEVLTATNGEEALEILETADKVSLLVSDVVMPMMDGPTMGREARKDRPDLPILFMSGYAQEQLRNSIDLDNVNFLPKPFSVQELAEAVRAVLAEGEGA